MAKPLKKAPKQRIRQNAVKVMEFAVQLGTPREYDEPRHFPTLPKAQKVVIEHFRSQEQWCKRHNSAGLDQIYSAIASCDTSGNYSRDETRTFIAHIDEYSGFTLAATIRRMREGELPPPPKKGTK